MNTLEFNARDGVKLSMLHQGHESPRGVVIVMHGSTYNGKRYVNLARAIGRQGFEVLLPDWRGHGQSGGARGDCDYIGQLEDDLHDLIDYYQGLSSVPIVLVGHSAGAVICLRYTLKYGCDKLSAIGMIAPAINGPLEAIRYDQAGSGWQYRVSYFRKMQNKPAIDAKALAQAQKFAPKLQTAKFWAAKFIPMLRHQVALSFPANPQMAKLEGRVLDYSYNMMMSCDLRDYPKAFSEINVPVCLMAGENDEILHPEFLSTVYHWHLPFDIDKQITELPKVNHMTVINAASSIIPKWLNEQFGALTVPLTQGEVA